MNRLPVDDVAPAFLDALAALPAVVVQAPPGAGKTTRLPCLILDDPRFSKLRILMLEPRRIAAVYAARFIAATRGESPGKSVGYATRFERVAGPATRLEVVTEGILSRRLQADPLLEGVDIVIFDEFHERSLNSDFSLALCRDIQKSVRPDLKIVVMSATLDAEPVARFLDNAPLVTSEGRAFPVDVRYEERDPTGALPDVVASGVRRALRETEGDVLAFLPGGGEIRRCADILSAVEGVEVCPLYADLPFDAQERALRPLPRRKVVLATTIAETSLTIEGVRVVVDSGWTRASRFDPASGLDRLVTTRVSAASAKQRTGRAGRTAPGISYRLWSRHVDRLLVPFAPPEIAVTDLAGLVLDLTLWGVHEPQGLEWLDPPDEARFNQGRRLLQELGALDHHGFPTRLGRDMSRLPLHPRLSRLIVAAEKEGSVGAACDVAALLSERDIFRNLDELPHHLTDSDILDRLEALRDWQEGRRTPGCDPGACRAVIRLSGLLRRRAGVADKVVTVPDATSVARLLAVAYPDRLAKRREKGADRFIVADGSGARLSRRSRVGQAEYVIAALLEPKAGGESLIHLASAISEEVVREVFADRIETRRIVGWDERERRVVAREDETCGAIILSSRPVLAEGDEVSAALAEGILRSGGMNLFDWSAAARQLQARVAFLRKHLRETDLPDVSDEALAGTLREWLPVWAGAARRLQDLASVDMLMLVSSLLTRDQLALIEKEAPSTIVVPTGSRLRIDYTSGVPVLAVKLQEMFGLPETPCVALGRVPVVLHLLSPAGRPVQVTTDLKGFWNSGYREVKKELKGRYPRHPWPDDPWTAPPMRGTKKKG